MSTEHQKYSTENQAEVIAQYAARRGFEIVKTYEDSGKSGLRLDGRLSLQQLIADVRGGKAADFEAILVYDVSRWGRFQDADESAYYEFICREAGIAVQYCEQQISAALLSGDRQRLDQAHLGNRGGDPAIFDALAHPRRQCLGGQQITDRKDQDLALEGDFDRIRHAQALIGPIRSASARGSVLRPSARSSVTKCSSSSSRRMALATNSSRLRASEARLISSFCRSVSR